jgi:hypothetical protein
MRKYRNYTDDDVVNYSKEVKSIAGLLRKLDLKTVGGNYRNIKRLIQKLNIDTNHWTGQGWNKGQQLKDWSEYTKVVNCKKHLIKEKGNTCEECKLSEWRDKPIPLEVHHLDGDNTNNELSNLQLVCCNCHAQTENWRTPKFCIDKVII